MPWNPIEALGDAGAPVPPPKSQARPPLPSTILTMAQLEAWVMAPEKLCPTCGHGVGEGRFCSDAYHLVCPTCGIHAQDRVILDIVDEVVTDDPPMLSIPMGWLTKLHRAVLERRRPR